MALQGNAVAMRALMEVLQGGEEGGEEEESGPREGGLGEVGGSVEERDVLLQALGSVRYVHSPAKCLELGERGVLRTLVQLQTKLSIGSAVCVWCVARDLYLGESLQRLCRPIDQMFPKVEGYSSAIPSKHDLQAFVRVRTTQHNTPHNTP